MATSKSVVKVTFINVNAVIPGREIIERQITEQQSYLTEYVELAGKMLNDMNRAGVNMAMGLMGTTERCIKGLERKIQRAARYRLSREERKAYNTDGTLPVGISAITLEADDDDDDDDSDI